MRSDCLLWGYEKEIVLAKFDNVQYYYCIGIKWRCRHGCKANYEDF